MSNRIWILIALLCMSVTLKAGEIISIAPVLPAEKTLKWWMPRFKSVKAKAAKGGYEVVFLGDSITHGWESRGKNVWAKYFADGPYKALNGGFSGDCTENLLWIPITSIAADSLITRETTGMTPATAITSLSASI